MATLREKLDAAIASQQSEVDRLIEVAKQDLPAAQATLAELQGVSAHLTADPEVETGYAVLKRLGVKLDTE